MSCQRGRQDLALAHVTKEMNAFSQELAVEQEIKSQGGSHCTDGPSSSRWTQPVAPSSGLLWVLSADARLINHILCVKMSFYSFWIVEKWSYRPANCQIKKITLIKKKKHLDAQSCMKVNQRKSRMNEENTGVMTVSGGDKTKNDVISSILVTFP